MNVKIRLLDRSESFVSLKNNIRKTIDETI